METKTKRFNIPKGGLLDVITKAFVLFILLSGVTMVTLTAFAGEDKELEYTQAVQQVQHFESALKTAKNNLCVVEKELATEKLAEHYSGVLELTQEDVDRLVGKTRNTCAGF